MKIQLNTVLGTAALIFALISGGEAVYIVNVHRQSAAWAQQVSADSVKMSAFSDSLANAALEIAARDSIIEAERAVRPKLQKAIDRSQVLVDVGLKLARDSAKTDSVRHLAYEAVIASMNVQLTAKTAIIASQEREIAQLTEIRDVQQEALGAAIRRVVELQELIAAAPAVQAPKSKGNVFKVVGGFLAGVGAGAITVLLIGAK